MLKVFRYLNQWWVGVSAESVAEKIAGVVGASVAEVVTALVPTEPEAVTFAEDGIGLGDVLDGWISEAAPCLVALELGFA